MVDKLLNKRYAALYPTVFMTYRRDTGEVLRGPADAGGGVPATCSLRRLAAVHALIRFSCMHEICSSDSNSGWTAAAAILLASMHWPAAVEHLPCCPPCSVCRRLRPQTSHTQPSAFLTQMRQC